MDNLAEILKRKPLKHVKKDWGQEIWFVNNEKENYCGKLLEVNQGQGFKMHFHKEKVETFIIFKGKLNITLIDTRDRSQHTTILEVNDCLDLDRFIPHQIEALETTQIIEVSTFHRDEDSYRI